jgi:hypothetical protein
MGGSYRSFMLVAAVLSSFVLASCSSSISEAEAESIATGFVQEHVKFFTRNDNSTLEIPVYTFDSVSTAAQGSDYAVSFSVSAQLGNDTKRADFLVTINGKGDVTDLKNAPKK